MTVLELEAPPKKGHRDAQRAFYTEDPALVAYMVGLLEPASRDQILEPCAGSGLFIDELIARNPSAFVDAVEIDRLAVRELRSRFQARKTVRVIEGDYLSSDDRWGIRPYYDKIIANPPYGAWQTPARRAELKRAYPDLYVKESATVFLAKAIATLREGGRAVFILPETFLFSHSHRALRKRILQTCAVESIDVFPSSLFPNVNFGYARLSILSLRKTQSTTGHRCIIRQAATIEQLVEQQGRTNAYDQAAIALTPELAFPVNGTCAVTHEHSSKLLTLGDIADCVTGFYSGDDARFLRRAPGNAKYAARYPSVDEEFVSRSQHASLQGLGGPAHFVPVLKGGGYAYLKPTMWYMDWSEAAVRHYKTDRKARFQNSSYYFRLGIGFPMVSSGGARASAILPDHLFDQSIVGIFPRDTSHFGFLLAFLNSDTAWSLLRQINPSTNNSAKYMRRLPISLPSVPDLDWFGRTVEAYVATLAAGADRNSALENELQAKVRNQMAIALRLSNDAEPIGPPDAAQ